MSESEHALLETLVIGSGFAGAVTSARLALAGYEVTLLERGRRYPPGSFPSMPRPEEVLPDLADWTWAVDGGLWDVHDLGPIRSVQAAGYGGGSLLYANVHLRAPEQAFEGWPEGFTRRELDPYYDLAAAMLDVSPYPRAAVTPKSRGLERVAGTLGRVHVRPPLAVNFVAQTDDLGQERPACNDCGACCTGCDVGAKNTLDHNYLAFAERAGAAVRTQTEVLAIAARTGGGYRVTCRDHLRGGVELVLEAERVFLCAGAMHTTRLLFESKLANDRCGRRFFGNGDSIAMIYDASEVLEPTQGPTITGAMVCEVPRDGAASPDWFLVQDGGYAEPLHRAFGLLRAPLLGDRNRFLERPARPPADDGAPFACAQPKWKVGGAQASMTTVARLAVDDPRLTLSATLPGLVPKQLRAYLRELVDALRKAEHDAVRATIRGLPKRLCAEARVRHPGQGALAHAALRVGALVASAMMRLLLCSDALLELMTRASAASFEAHLGLEGPRSTLLENNLTRALGLRDRKADPGGRRRMMLLAMGDDRDAPRTLDFRRVRGERATNAGRLGLYAAEERVFRDVATTLGGELRVNPMYTRDLETVTVHGQGGCGMSADAAHGVTNPEGEVHGRPGLYVMDAACFPAPVGANPTATILAVAERNVARFVAKHRPRRERADELADLREKARRRVDAWVAKAGATAMALAAPRGRRGVVTAARPVGLVFAETMRGFVHPATTRPTTSTEYARLEAMGRGGGTYVTLELVARIPDLVAFREDPSHAVALRGRVQLGPPGPGATRVRVANGSRLLLLGQTDPSAGTYDTMRYELRGASGSRAFSLDGFKYIRDHEGFDSWEDTTRLFVEVTIDGTPHYGIVRLSMEDFAGKMLPSFRVTGTKDPARRAWAIATFGGYFFSKLQRVYLPELAGDLADALGVR